MAHKKLQATATLFLDTSNAQSDAKKFVNDIKQKLAEVETAADKMSVFKDVVGYIAQIDRALTALKDKNADAFKSAFGNLDIDLKKQLEGIFGIDGTKLNQLDVLREKLNSLTPKSSIKEIRNFAKEINALFSSVGLDSPFDDINEQFSGRTTTKHIQDLAVTLAKFSNVWDDVASRMAGGFGVGGTGSGGGGFSGPSKEIQEEIDRLKKQKEDIASIVKQIKEVTKMSSAWEDGDTIDLDFEATEEAAKKLIDKFKQLDDAINNNEFDDKSVAYAEALAERAKIALQLIEINNRLTKTDRDGKVIQSSPDFLKNFLADNEDGDNIVNYAIEDFADEAEDQLKNLRQELENTTKQINELKTSVKDVFGAASNNVPASDAFENIGDAAENAGDKVDTFSKKVDNLNESIKKVYMSALDLEVDTRNGNASGKEFMNLFDADGVVSTTEGVDYHVDTDTLVQQLVANLNRDIVMSLHNHANGDMTFSPSDISSFAKMYYGQGTKINGIIANGFIHTIDFNSIGQEVAIQIAQDYQDGIQHLFEAKNIAQFASFENGSIVPSDLLKQTQISNPEYYQEIIDHLQEAQMTVLRQAFEKNGAEFTLQSFGLDNIDELSTYLANVQKNTQNAIEPVEKLKNLISTLRPSFDLSEFTEVFDKFKNGAIDGSQALNQVLNLTPVASSANETALSIDKAKTKLEEFLAFAEKMQHENLYGSAENNVDIGKYLERLETAKTELKELGAQGLLTAEDLEKVNQAFTEAAVHLDAETSHYDSYYSGPSYDYYDEYKEQQERAQSAEGENIRLQRQLDTMRQLSDLDRQIGLSDDNLDDIQRENGALQDRLEILQDIADAYGVSITQRDRNRYDELNTKEMESGLSSREEDRMSELSDRIDEADTNLLEFEQTYDRIILKLANGKKIEILPDDDGLRKLYKISNEYYNGEYNGIDIEDVIFERKQEQNIIEGNNNGLREQLRLQEQINHAKSKESKQDVTFYDSTDGQLAFFDNILQGAQRAEDKVEQLENAVKRVYTLDGQMSMFDSDYSATRQQNDVVDSNEVVQLEVLQQKLLEVRQAVDEKTQAFKEESVAVDTAVDAEIASLNKLKDVLTEIQEILQIVFSVSKINVGDVELTQSKENVNAVSGAIQTIEQTLGQILAVLQGFTGLEADGKNSITHKEAAVKSPVNTADATERLASKLSDVATEGTLSQIPKAINNLADAVLSRKNAEIQQMAGNSENAHFVTDARGNPLTMYRGINGAMSGLVSNRYHGGTFFTDSVNLAKRYAGINGKVESTNISMKNPLEIDVDEHQWNDIEYLGNGADEASKKIRKLKKELNDLSQWALSNLDLKVNLLLDKDFNELEEEVYNIIDNNWSDDDQLSRIQSKKYNDYLENVRQTRQEYLDISNDDSNVYGWHDTNRFVELAKNSGYDGVIFRNIKDGTNEISNIVVTLQENQIHFIETLKTNFESLLTDFIGYFGNIEDFMSYYKNFKTDSSLFPGIDDDGRAIFGEQLEKYENLSLLGEPVITNEFLNKNKILGAYDQRVPGGLDSLLAMDDMDERIDAIVNFYLSAIYELEKIQEAFNTKAISVEEYGREQSGNLTSYDKISKIESGYSDRELNDRESYKYSDATVEDLHAKKEQAIAAANAFKELFASFDIETSQPEQLKNVVDNFVNTIKLIDDAQSMATGIVENSHYNPDAMREFHELGPIRDTLTADYLDILAAEAQQIEQVEIDMQKAHEQSLTDTTSDSSIQEEIVQLDKLKAALDEVKNAVIAKTKAFIDEGNTVGQSVGKEIASLKNLSEVIDNIVPKISSLVENLNNIDAAKLGSVSSETKTSIDTVVQDAPVNDPFKAKLSAQTGVFTRYRKDIKDVDYLTEDLEKQIDSLGISLREVTNQSELDTWIKRFNNLKENVQAAKSEFEQINLGTVNLFQRELTNSFGKLTLPQREGMLQEYLQAIVLLDKQKQAVKDGHAVEIAAIKEITVALQEKINAQIESNKAAKDTANAQKKNGNFGSTASINATAKYNSLTRAAGSEQFANSSEIAAALVQYEQAYRDMIAMRDRLRNQDIIDDSDREAFKQATVECNTYASALDKLIKNTMKLKGNKVNPDDYMLGGDFDYSDIEQRKAALADFVQQTYGLSVAAEDFRDGWNKVVFAVDNGDGTFTQMTATFTDARNEIVALAGDVKKSQGLLSSFWDELKGKFKSIGSYLIASVSFYEIWAVIKQGVTYVKEIDSALTELKKVTNETDATYKNFLQDMAKTGSVVGATVQDLTTMAADWARLGYSLEEAGKLAESTAILLNVSEFQDATAASEALISTMQAFQYTADESGHVVDILNEVGKIIARR